MMAERGVVLSYETVRNWCDKYGQQYAKRLKKRRGPMVTGKDLVTGESLSPAFEVAGILLGTVGLKGPAKAAQAAKTAEAAADAALRAGRTKGAAAELRVGDEVFTDVSTGGAPRTLNGKVVEALNAVPAKQRAPWHGGCAEAGCVSKALDAGVNPTGGTSRAVNIGESGAGHGTSKMACSSCRSMLDFFGIKHD